MQIQAPVEQGCYAHCVYENRLKLVNRWKKQRALAHSQTRRDGARVPSRNNYKGRDGYLFNLRAGQISWPLTETFIRGRKAHLMGRKAALVTNITNL